MAHRCNLATSAVRASVSARRPPIQPTPIHPTSTCFTCALLLACVPVPLRSAHNQHVGLIETSGSAIARHASGWHHVRQEPGFQDVTGRRAVRPRHLLQKREPVLRKRTCALGAGAALAVTALFAEPAAAQKVGRHAIIEAKSDAGFAMMAKARGFGERQGLSLEIMQIKADQIGLKALLAGELDSYEGGPGGAIVAAARGADVKILGCHWPGLVHGLFVRESVTKVEDLRGGNIAIS